MSKRLQQVLRERRKALAPLLATVVAEAVFVITGTSLDVASLTALAGAVVAVLVHETPNDAPA